MPQFFKTYMGQKFYEHDIPKVAEHLNEIADQLCRANNLKERELRLKEHELELKYKNIKGELVDAK